MIKFKQDLEKLKKKLLEMAAVVEDMVGKSVKSLKDKNMLLSQEVVNTDEKVNDMEIEIDNMAIRILALYQPEAADLRAVTMIMNINRELERIGDHAVSIAEMAMFLSERHEIKPLNDIPRMAEKSVEMLKESLDAFVNQNADLAVQVCKKDDIVDNLEPQIVRELITFIMAEPGIIDRALRYIYIARHLERVADLATNIAEDAYYITTGKVLKHHHTSELN